MNNISPSRNHKYRFVCNGCGCLVLESSHRCVNDRCQFYQPGIFGRKLDAQG